MQKIERAQATITELDSQLPPKMYVKPGETFMVETQDNFFGSIKSEEDHAIPEHMPFLHYQIPRANPVAGPIYVEGLKAGDLLVLEIEDIIPAETGWTGFSKYFGNLARHYDFPELQEPFSRIIQHKPGPSGTTSDGTGTFHVNRDVIFPLKPFIGTIGTAPEIGVVDTVVSQGSWGGNIDVRDIRKGNKIMMNTFHDGGLLFIGDVHGAQGDSEYTAFADETAADTIAKCSIIPQKRIPGILRIETPTSLIQVESSRNAGGMDKALNGAFMGMMQWLTQDYGLDSKEVYMQFSVNPGVVIHTYQFIHTAGFYVVGVEFPKKYL